MSSGLRLCVFVFVSVLGLCVCLSVCACACARACASNRKREIVALAELSSVEQCEESAQLFLLFSLPNSNSLSHCPSNSPSLLSFFFFISPSYLLTNLVTSSRYL